MLSLFYRKLQINPCFHRNRQLFMKSPLAHAHTQALNTFSLRIISFAIRGCRCAFTGVLQRQTTDYALSNNQIRAYPIIAWCVTPNTDFSQINMHGFASDFQSWNTKHQHNSQQRKSIEIKAKGGTRTPDTRPQYMHNAQAHDANNCRHLVYTSETDALVP